MSRVQAVRFPPVQMVMFLITGTLMSGWVFRQNDKMEMQIKKTEITPMNYIMKKLMMIMIVLNTQYLSSIGRVRFVKH